MGRKKITIRRIESEAARSVCFSKRRAGLFKKASDLAVLCGAEVASVVFSPGGKAFSFGHPSVKAIGDRLLAGGGAGDQGAADDDDLKELTVQLDELRTGLEELKARKQRVDGAIAKDRAMGDPIAAWLDPNLSDIGEEEMKAFDAALMEVQAAVSARANQVLLETLNIRTIFQAPSPPPPPPPQLFGGSTYEFGSSSGNAGMEMMVMPPPPGFAAGTDMQQMRMEMPPQPELNM